MDIAEIKVQSDESKDDYTYQVFNSDKQTKPQYSDQFEGRASNYHYKNVSLTLSCTEKAITPFGGMFFGGSMTWTIKSDPASTQRDMCKGTSAMNGYFSAFNGSLVEMDGCIQCLKY